MAQPVFPAESSDLVAALQAEVDRLEKKRPEEAEFFSTGIPPLDALLPGGGLRRGMLVEWLAAGAGSGAGMLAVLALREACRVGAREGAWVVCDRWRQFYPPAAIAWGLDLGRLILLQPASEADERWAIEQCLRCPGVAAVWSPLVRINATTFRRWQLAAETGGTLGLFLRPARARGEPTWAQVQIAVTPRAGPSESGAGRRWRLEVVRSPTGGGGAVEIELNQATGEIRALGETHHVTHSLSPAAELAAAKAGQRPGA